MSYHMALAAKHWRQSKGCGRLQPDGLRCDVLHRRKSSNTCTISALTRTFRATMHNFRYIE
jgi:hypothetical protein